MKRLAAPMVGGVASAMLLTLIVIAAISAIWRWQTQVKKVDFQGRIQKGDIERRHQQPNGRKTTMKTPINAVTMILVMFLLVPVLSWADMKDKGVMGSGMMEKGQMPMMQGKEMECQDMQMMHEMMGMMHEMMGMTKGMMQDPTMQDKMEKRMERMQEMMKQHEHMMDEHKGMMKKGKE